MLSKTKKLLFLSTGLAGALTASAAAGVALSACSVEAVNGGNTSSGGITLPDTWYNKDINWTDATSLNNLITDSNGFVYSNKYFTEIIAILPGYESSTLTIPSTVTSITGYNKVTVSNGVTTKTATGAFEGLTSITNIKFAGNKVTTIGARAFYGCTGLQNITLPSSVTLVDTNAFYNCSSLNTINLNYVQYIGINAFANSMTEVPEGSVDLNLNKTTYIASGAFQNATGIGSADFSKNTTLTQIAESAFEGCTNLAGDIDLTNATKLITIGSSSSTATGSSFKGTAITNVYLPTTSGLRTIAADTFSGCASLVTVGAKGTTGFTPVASVTTIGTTAFTGTKITAVDLSNLVYATPLASGAFKGMEELATVNLGSVITTIPAETFMNDTALTTLTLPESITSISGGTTTTVGTTITATDGSYPAFYGSGLTTIDLSTITSYSTTSGSTLALPATLFWNCASLTTVTLKEGTTAIGEASFAKTTALATITTANATNNVSTGYAAAADITDVGQSAFYGSGITSVDLSAITNTSYNQLNNATFRDCAQLTTLKLPSTITSIYGGSVYNTPELTSVNFDNLTNLTTINNYNFTSNKLATIDLSNTKITALSGDYLFTGLLSTTVVSLPSTFWNISSGSVFSYNNTTTDGGTSTTTQVLLSLNFPKGFAPSSSLTNGNLVDHTMFSRITSSLDFSSYSNLKSISKRTLFGGDVGSLTFNASTFATGYFGTNTASTYNYLGFIGVNATSGANSGSLEYAATSLPFGSNSSLSAFTFGNFTAKTIAEGTTVTNPLEKTTDATWSQVTRIINSFGKESTTATETTTNLTDWSTNSAGEAVEDLTPNISYDAEDNTKITSVELNTTSGTTVATISTDSAASQTFDYAGLTWTIAIDTTNQTITLSATDANMYRVVTGTTAAYSNSYKAFFTTADGTYTPDDGSDSTTVVVPGTSNITLTLNVVTA